MLPGGDRISHYKGVSWSDSTPVIVRNRLIDAFRSDGRISALSSDEHSLHADLELVSDLRAFQIEYQNGKPNAVIGGISEFGKNRTLSEQVATRDAIVKHFVIYGIVLILD